MVSPNWAAALRPIANLLAGMALSCRLGLERMFGLGSRPNVAAAFALAALPAPSARRRGLTSRPADAASVAVFVDTFANVFDPTIAAKLTVAVLGTL